MLNDKKVKKVPAFPIAAQIKTASGVIPAKVVKMATVGLMVEANVEFKLGECLEIEFTFPVVNKFVSEAVVVVKILNQLGGRSATGNVMTRVIEMHFRSLTDSGRNSINAFLRQIQNKAA